MSTKTTLYEMLGQLDEIISKDTNLELKNATYELDKDKNQLPIIIALCSDKKSDKTNVLYFTEYGLQDKTVYDKKLYKNFLEMLSQDIDAYKINLNFIDAVIQKNNPKSTLKLTNYYNKLFEKCKAVSKSKFKAYIKTQNSDTASYIDIDNAFKTACKYSKYLEIVDAIKSHIDESTSASNLESAS